MYSYVQDDPARLRANRDGTHLTTDQTERGLDEIKHHAVLMR
jgi:hypothetical protein